MSSMQNELHVPLDALLPVGAGLHHQGTRVAVTPKKRLIRSKALQSGHCAEEE